MQKPCATLRWLCKITTGYPGVSFVFPGDIEGYLVRKYKKLGKKVKSDSESVRRFVSFFRLSKTDGLKGKYEGTP